MAKSKPSASDVEAAEVSAIETVTAEFDPDPFFARGDARDAMLNVIRSATDWGKFNEARQRDINRAVDNAASEIVTKITRALAAEGRQTVSAIIDSINLKDGGIKVVAKASFSAESLVLLANAKAVEIAVADARASQNERAPARVDADEPELPVGEENDDDLVNAADPIDPVVRTGDCVEIEGKECEIEVNLVTGMIEATERGANAAAERIDVRQATPEELAAERESRQDDIDGLKNAVAA
jgi:hypothetical protein